MTKAISVALATYNGERYLEQQLQSISAQTYLPSELVVTDDTSSDKTLELLEEFARTAPFPVRIHLNDVRLGYRANFMGAIALCQSELIALCDQDDVWDPDKLAIAAASFETPGTVLFFHDAWLIDDAGSRLGPANIYRLPRHTPPLSAHSLFGPFGFSIVFHRDLIQFSDLWGQSVDANDAQSRTGHDHWLFFLASIFGEITYDERKLTGYRQHQSNTFGRDSSLSASLRYRLRLIRNNGSQYTRHSRVARARAQILADCELRLTGVWLDRARAGERGCSRLADRLALRAQLYSSMSLWERARIFRALRRVGAYTTDAGFGLGREVMMKDVALGVVFQRLLIPLRPKSPMSQSQVDP